MTWVRLDDGFLDHPKFLKAGPLAGYLAICAIAWSGRNLTDGHIPEEQLPRLINLEGLRVKPKDLADKLVKIGLWDRTEEGWLVHDFHEYQSSRAEVEERREQTRERVKAWRKDKSGNANVTALHRR